MCRQLLPYGRPIQEAGVFFINTQTYIYTMLRVGDVTSVFREHNDLELQASTMFTNEPEIGIRMVV